MTEVLPGNLASAVLFPHLHHAGGGRHQEWAHPAAADGQLPGGSTGMQGGGRQRAPAPSAQGPAAEVCSSTVTGTCRLQLLHRLHVSHTQGPQPRLQLLHLCPSRVSSAPCHGLCEGVGLCCIIHPDSSPELGNMHACLRMCLCAACACRSMPEDAAARCSDGSCWISVTQVFPRPANKLYGAFDSRAQLIKALLASCHLPR